MATSDRSLDTTKRLLQEITLRTLVKEVPRLQGSPDAPPKPREVIRMNSSTTVADALKTLRTYSILSAPVSDANTNEYIGIFDIMDALGGLLRRMYPELLREGFLETHKRLSMTELQALGVEFGSQAIASMLHGGDLWFKGDPDSTLYEVVESGFRVGVPPRVHSPQHHLRVHHRVALFDILPGEQTPDGPIPEWRITDIVSQSDVLRYLASQMDDLSKHDAGLSATLADHGMVQGANELATVTAATPALIALAKMQRERLSGLGIVNKPDGQLLANLSASDLRGLTPERFGALALSVGAFLLFMHPRNAREAAAVTYEDALLDSLPAPVKEGKWEEALGGMPLICCTPATTLREIIDIFVRYGVHRVYICQGEVPVGVVTPTDVLRAIISPKTGA